MRPSPRTEAVARVALSIEDAALRRDATAALAVRGVTATAATTPEDALTGTAAAVGFAPTTPLTAARAAELAPLGARAAERDAPLVILHPAARGLGSRADSAAAALAFLRAHGAVICHDPDVWLEALVLITRIGIPGGTRVALIAPPGSWLAAAAAALEAEIGVGARRPALADVAERVGPADVVLGDPAELATVAAGRISALVVPVIGRGELAGALGGDQTALIGLRGALGAVDALGQFAERRTAGLGPATAVDEAALAPDRERFARQLARLATRAGDHEAKVLLAAYRIPVTRQAVATTPSAATRLAKRAGYPVELKPWGDDVPTELEGCPVETALENAADVRRAFATVGRQLGHSAGAPVIVRETPPPGRELRVRVVRLAELGWTTLVDVAGQPGSVAAPAPLRPIDADALAQGVVASRAGEAPPDRAALADLLVRVSHIGPANPRVVAIDLPRVIAAHDDRAVVIDARVELDES